MSNGTPTTAASSWSGEVLPGNRMNVAIPPKRGISFPPSGCGKAGVVMSESYRPDEEPVEVSAGEVSAVEVSAVEVS